MTSARIHRGAHFMGSSKLPGPLRRARMGTVAEIVRVTCHEAPDDTSTHWTTRSLAKRFGIGKDAIARVWADHNLKPWRVDTFKLSTDPHFEEKLVDVVGLYMNPPARAVVFGFDEKTQCQAMDRTQPSLPMVPGRAGTMTHDYKRNGTTDLFAAMNLATGQVLTHCHKGHTAKDVLAFFKQIDASVPRGLAVHVVLDNLSAHKAPEITRWLGHRDRRRWHLHFTPTSSSWVNLIERWFKELTDKRLRRGVFTNVLELVEAITTWGSHWNEDPSPFIWHASADELIEKVQRGRAPSTARPIQRRSTRSRARRPLPCPSAGTTHHCEDGTFGPAPVARGGAVLAGADVRRAPRAERGGTLTDAPEDGGDMAGGMTGSS